MTTDPRFPGPMLSLPDEQPEPEVAGFFEAFGTNFQRENPTYNAWKYLTQEKFQYDPEYDNTATIKADGMWERRDAFREVRSRAHYNFLKGKLAEEDTARRDYSQSWGGLLGGMTAGIFDPTIFIPLVGPGARGLTALKQAALLGGATAGLQEVPLQLNQVDRSMEESATSVLGGAVVAGVLGGLAGALRARDYARYGREMGTSPRELPIPRLGADSAEQRLMPVTTPFTVGKGFDPAAEHPFFSAEAPDNGKAYEIAPKNAFVVSPESMRLLDIGPDDSLESIIAKAKENDADALIFEGFDELRMTLGETAGRLNRTVRELEDGIRVLDKRIIKEIGRDGVIVHPRFGNGLVDHPITRDIETGLPAAAGAQATPEELVNYNPLDNGTYRETSGTKKNWATKAFDPAADRISPVNRMINQPNAPGGRVLMTGRWMQQQMSVGGQRMQENVVNADGSGGTAVSPGGTIIDLRTVQYGKYLKAHEKYLEARNEYIFGSPKKKLGGSLRANIAAKQQGKMGSKEFSVEVGRAMIHKNVHPTLDNPHINKAAKAYSDVMEEMFEEAKAAKIYGESTEVVGDTSYLNRVSLPRAVKQRYTRLVEVLTEYYVDEVLKPEFEKSLLNMIAKRTAQEQFEKDVALGSVEALAERQKILNELKDAELKKTEDVLSLEDTIFVYKERLADYRAQAKELKAADPTDPKKPYEKEMEALKKNIKFFEDQLLTMPDPFREMKAGHRARLRGLNKNRAVVAGQMAAKLEKIERIEELAISTLSRASRAVRKVLDNFDTLDDATLNKRLSELRTQFAKTGKIYDTGEERLTKLRGEDGFEAVMMQQEKRGKRLTEIAEQLDEVEGFDREGWKELVELAERDILEKANDINSRRALRQAKLEEAAAKMTQPEIEKALAKERGKYSKAQTAFEKRWDEKTKGSVNYALDGDAPDFTAFAKKRAIEVADGFARMTNRLPVHDLIIGLHGPERARMLKIGREKIEFILENDAETLMRTYMRTLAPDIEIAKKFGDVNATKYFKQLEDEAHKQVELLEKEVDADGKPLSAEAKAKLSEQIFNNYNEVDRILRGQLARLRHLWGIPQNPEGFAFRAGTQAMNLNVLRYMGMVVPASVADPGRIIMRNGLLNTFQDVFVPLVTNFQNFTKVAEEGYLAGEIADLFLHTRSNAMHDVMDDMRFGTKFERGTNFVTQRMGQIALFDYWNVWMKQLTAVGTVAHIMRGMQAVMEGGVDAAATKKYMEYLASLQLDSPQIERIWKQVKATGGGNKVRGLWYPNTEMWLDKEAQRAFRAALAGQITDTIITPGLEIPMVANSNMGFKMAFQFRSFGFSSVTKTLMAGLQQSDMAVMNGSLISLALGAFSYYLWAVAVGGKALEEATDWSNPDRLMRKYADEAIDRSGLLAVGSDVQELATRLPWIGPYANFSGQYNSKRANQNILELFTGPTMDLLNKGSHFIVNLDKPTEASIHSGRLMVPFQNHFALRRGFEAIEKATGRALGVPARREQ